MNTKKTFCTRHLKVSIPLAVVGFYVIYRAALPFILVWQKQNFILFPSEELSFSIGISLIGFSIAFVFHTSSYPRVSRYAAVILFASFIMFSIGSRFEGNMQYHHYDLYLAEKGYKPCPNAERWMPPLSRRQRRLYVDQIKYRTWWRDSSEPCDKILIRYTN